MQTELRSGMGELETDAVVVRNLRETDLDAVVAIDEASGGRRRPQYFELMLQRSVKQAGLQISLVAELDQKVAGFLIASLYYGEYGVVEPTASIDTIGVHPRSRGLHVGKAMMRQLRLNLGALHITTLRTEIAWDDLELAGFFSKQGFSLSKRLCLESHLDPTEIRE